MPTQIERIINHGLVKVPPFKEQDFFAGVVEKNILKPSGQWDDHLIEVEYQKDYTTGFDSMSCVTFSAENCIETLYNFFGEKKNFSDRFTAVDSGTKPGVGNSLRNVAESIRKTGLVDQAEYPFVGTEKEYFQKIPGDVRNKAYNIPVSWEWGHGGENLVQWHKEPQEVLCQLLQYAPVQVTVWAYGKKIVNDIYQPHGVTDENHAVMLFGFEYGKYFKIFDHYTKSIKKLHWNYGLQTPLLFTLDGKINLAKKYAGRLFKNQNSNKIYHSNGEQIVWITNEQKFLYGKIAKFWGGFETVQTVLEPIKEDFAF